MEIGKNHGGVVKGEEDWRIPDPGVYRVRWHWKLPAFLLFVAVVLWQRLWMSVRVVLKPIFDLYDTIDPNRVTVTTITRQFIKSVLAAGQGVWWMWRAVAEVATKPIKGWLTHMESLVRQEGLKHSDDTPLQRQEMVLRILWNLLCVWASLLILTLVLPLFLVLLPVMLLLLALFLPLWLPVLLLLLPLWLGVGPWMVRTIWEDGVRAAVLRWWGTLVRDTRELRRHEVFLWALKHYYRGHGGPVVLHLEQRTVQLAEQRDGGFVVSGGPVRILDMLKAVELAQEGQGQMETDCQGRVAVETEGQVASEDQGQVASEGQGQRVSEDQGQAALEAEVQEVVTEGEGEMASEAEEVQTVSEEGQEHQTVVESQDQTATEAGDGQTPTEGHMTED